MENMQREDLEAISQKQEQQMAEDKQPYTVKQRMMAWIAVAVVLFGLFGTLYWMFSFVPGA